MSCRLWLFGVLLGLSAAVVCADEVDDDLALIAKVGAQAAGSVEAREASERLKRRGPDVLPRLLDALNTPNVVAANWYRTVFDDVVRSSVERKSVEWPIEKLRAFVQDSSMAGRPRRLALSLLDRLEPTFSGEWIITRLDDPEFRNEAVDATIRAGDAEAKNQQPDAARRNYRLAFSHARESEQVLLAARKLGELGDAVDPVRHLGFVTRWFLAGPFDAPGMSGFDASFPPENPFDPAQRFTGAGQPDSGWKEHVTQDALGQVDLIRAIAPVREAVGYAYAELRSAVPQDVQLRCSADDNLTVWLNGEKVLARRQWLNGTRLDRFTAPVKLTAGVNRVLVKICQGPQHVDPAVPNNWTFQLRFCDATGAGAAIEVVRPAAKVEADKEPAK